MNIVDKLFPQSSSGWLKSYIDYCVGITDAPPEYHLGVGLTILAAVCGNKVYFKGFAGVEMYPNLYTLLIGPSGFRKGWALKLGMRVLDKARVNVTLNAENTRESFLRELAEKPACLFVIEEFSSQLALWTKEYMSGMKQLVTDLYDPRTEYRRGTIKMGKVTITNPALNLLAASNPGWLMERLTEHDLRGGLMGRFLIFPADTKLPFRGILPDIEHPVVDSLADAISQLGAMKKAYLSFDEVRTPFNEWLKDKEHQLDREYHRSDLMGFYSRVGTHCMKLAVLFHMAKCRPAESCIDGAKCHDVDSKSLSQAEILIDWLHEQAKESMERLLTFSKMEKDIQRYLTYIRISRSGIDRSELLKLSHDSKRYFDQVIETMQVRGEVVSLPVKTPGRTKTIYMLPERKQLDTSQPE